MELIEYKKSLKIISNNISCLEFSRIKDDDTLTNTFAKIINIKYKIEIDVGKNISEPKNGDTCVLLTMIMVSLEECVRVVEHAHDKITMLIYTCKPIIDQCLEILEDYTISNEEARRRYIARKAINSHITDLILITKDVKKDDICSRYSVINKLMEILEYVQRELNEQKDNNQSHVYIKTLKDLDYNILHALDFFLRANIMFQIEELEYYTQAMSLVIKLRSIIERRLSIEPGYNTEDK